MRRPTRFLQHHASQEMDALYKCVTTVAFAHGVVTPSEEFNLYITHVNDILSEENSFHNQCLAAKKKDAPTFDSTSDHDTDPQDPIQGSEA